jgi:hypothetical protein
MTVASAPSASHEFATMLIRSQSSEIAGRVALLPQVALP